MRELPQWVLSGADKAPQAVDVNGKLKYVSATRPSEWMTFEQAVAGAWLHANHVTTHTTREGVVISRTGLDLGFVLHEGDPFSCIDLDVKDAETHPDKPEVWTSADDFQRFVSIITNFDSYTERSRSGKGIHVWVEGKIGRGFKRDGVEVYSQERFMICTGDVYVDQPIQPREMMLQNMVTRMRPIASEKTPLEEHPPESDDWYIFAMAAQAANADKFWQLWRGDWTGLGYKSQSDADLALMSMFTFYTDSNSQCRSLFRASGLGKREKATKDDRYVDLTLRLIRSRQAREQAADLSGLLTHEETVLALREAVQAAQGGATPGHSDLDPHREVQQLQTAGQGDPVQPLVPSASAIAQLAPVPARIAKAGEDGLPWPPGFTGTIAKFIYANSYLPIKEVSIVAALGLMAGICGKAWHIPQSGLNLYVILVARSAIGKEAMHSGIATLVTHCAKKYPFFSEFVNFTEYASGPALVKACLTSPSFVNVSGEWGRRLKRLAADEGKDGPLQTLRTQMTNLYQKSGPQSIAGGMSYSNTESNVASVAGVAYSMIGESTPGTFYEALTEGMMEDGFLSRFLIVGYDGDRPAQNPSMLTDPDMALVDALVALATESMNSIAAFKSQPVGRTEEAATLMAEFDAEAYDNITVTDDESRRQMWNRATLKALRVAALLAVGDHFRMPCINRTHMEWAIDLVRRDIAMMSKRMESGDVGAGDKARERKLVATIKDYIIRKEIPKSYGVNMQMHKDGILPRKYLHARTQQVAAFYNHKLGHQRALDDAITQCISNGWLMLCDQPKVIEAYHHHGKAYRVLDLPDYAVQGNKSNN
jgi:hypothetical protein